MIAEAVAGSNRAGGELQQRGRYYQPDEHEFNRPDAVDRGAPAWGERGDAVLGGVGDLIGRARGPAPPWTANPSRVLNMHTA